jgi:hypothetical protein
LIPLKKALKREYFLIQDCSRVGWRHFWDVWNENPIENILACGWIRGMRVCRG